MEVVFVSYAFRVRQLNSIDMSILCIVLCHVESQMVTNIRPLVEFGAIMREQLFAPHIFVCVVLKNS